MNVKTPCLFVNSKSASLFFPNISTHMNIYYIPFKPTMFMYKVKVYSFSYHFTLVMVPRGRARSEISRVIRICRYFLSLANFDFLLCVCECEQKPLLPLLPLIHLCYTFTCVCAGWTIPVCPFLPILPLLLDSLSLVGIHPFPGSLLPQLNCEHPCEQVEI